MLIRIDSPKRLQLIWPWVEKYLSKAAQGEYQEELELLTSSFNPNSRIYLLIQVHEDRPIGYILVSEERAYSMRVLQACSDDIKRLEVDLDAWARKRGFGEYSWETHRDPEAWRRLVGAKVSGYILQKTAIKEGHDGLS